MLDQDCKSWTAGLKNIGDKYSILCVELGNKEADLDRLEIQKSELDKMVEELIFDEATVEKEITFDEKEELLKYQFFTRNPDVSENSFAFSGSGRYLAVQSGPRSIDFYDARLDMMATFSIDEGELIRNFYFIGNCCIIDYYCDDLNGIKLSRVKYYPAGVGQSRMITSAGEYWLENGPGREVIWQRNASGSREILVNNAVNAGFVLDGSERVRQLVWMKIKGDYLFCQTHGEILVFRIDNGKMGLVFSKDTYASAIHGDKIAFVDQLDDKLVILDLSDLSMRSIIKDETGHLSWQKTFDSTGKNLITIDTDQIVRVFNLEKKRIVAMFRAFEGDEWLPSQIGCTPDGKIIVSAGHGKRQTKIFSLPGLEKWQ